MSDDMRLLRMQLESRLKEETNGFIDRETLDGIAGGLMIALYLIDHLHDAKI